MNKQSDHLANYQGFENAVVGPVRAYWREHDPRLLDQAIRVVAELDRAVNEHVLVPKQVVTVSGWLSRRHQYTISARALRRLNPGYRVKVRRHRRTDVALSRRTNGFFVGFKVEATGPNTLDPFLFGTTARRGRTFVLAGSNNDVDDELRFFAPRQGSALCPPTENHGPTPIGYVDEILQAPHELGRRPETWLGALVHRNPLEVAELADTPEGRFIALASAPLLRTFPSNGRHADRLEAIAAGRSGTFVSDLIPLHVSRSNPTPYVATDLTTVPDLVEEGHRLRAVPGTRPMPIPSDEWLTLDNAVVQEGGTVTVGDTLINYERSADPSLDFVAGQWDTVFGNRTHPDLALLHRRPFAEDEIPSGILLSGRNDANWFHWIIEYLPRVMDLDASIDPSTPLLVSKRTPATGLAALADLTSREVVLLDTSKATRVGRLHVTAPPVQVLDSTRVPWPDGISMNPRPLLAMRAAWGLNDDSRSSTPERRVFLSRRSAHRGLRNEAQLAEIARAHGFEILEPGSMSWADQLELFSTTTVLAGASGAVMANYLLMPPGSTILALTSKPLWDFVLPAAIAAVADVRFSYLVGDSAARLEDQANRNSWMHSDFHVDSGTFRAALTEVLETS